MPHLRLLSRALGAIALAATVSACQPATAPPGSGAAPRTHPGLALAKSSCSACHAVEQQSVSPNSSAPPFSALVNRPGLTRNSLAVWLRNAHNYPVQMNFTLEPRDAERIAAYMVTLRDPAARRGL